MQENIRLAFEVFHNIQEPIINVWVFHESDFDLIEIAQSILKLD